MACVHMHSQADKSRLQEKRNGPGLLEVLCIENRGLGRSSAPLRKRQYSTTIMAKDVLSVMVSDGQKQRHSSHQI